MRHWCNNVTSSNSICITTNNTCININLRRVLHTGIQQHGTRLISNLPRCIIYNNSVYYINNIRNYSHLFLQTSNSHKNRNRFLFY